MGTQSSRYLGSGPGADDDPAYELISDYGSNPEGEEALPEGAAILQFTSPFYFVEENEGRCVVDVMRLGSQTGRVSCLFHTEDMSGKAGLRYEATEGILVFEDGEAQKSVPLLIIESDQWAPTLEFKLCLTQPKNCTLGTYLHTCRVKVIDDDLFPSDRYPAVQQGIESIERVGHIALFSEYWKMNLAVPGNCARTLTCILFDQMRNAYTYFKLWAIIYMLNETFKYGTPLTIDQRREEVLFIGLGYILPMIALHAWDLAKVQIDLGGHSRSYLQTSLVTKWLNYNTESRSQVSVAEIEIAIREDCQAVADGYVAALALVRLSVKFLVILYFVHLENPRAMGHVMSMLALMLMFSWLRSARLSKAYEVPMALTAQLLEYVAETGRNYRLISNYAQRPHTNHTFFCKVSVLQKALISPNTVHVNNDYFTQWLGPLFIGIYIITHAQYVLMGELGHGTFIATLNVFNEISACFSEAYIESMALTSIAGVMNQLIEKLNLPTDLLAWKAVNRERRASTKVARQLILDQGKVDHAFPTDLILFQFKGVGFEFEPGQKFLHDVNLQVSQGSMVAVLGEHGMGRQTFLRLIAHELFPTRGEIFIPTHLRILHVSQELYTLDSSALLNVTFGHTGSDIDLVKHILERLVAPKLVEEVCRDHAALQVQSKRPSTDRTTSGSSEMTEDDFEDLEGCGSSSTWCSPCCCSVEELEVEVPDCEWLKRLSYSERAKLHLARALIMNPEVMVLQRPLVHFNQQDQTYVLDLLQEHVRNRGLGLPPESVHMRRPRTVFLSVETSEQAQRADVVWTMNESSAQSSVSVVSKRDF